MNRIYRDIRFKTDKTPYKTNLSSVFYRASAHRRGTYYMHLELGNVFAGGGFWAPNSEDLKTIRERIALEESEYRAVLNQPDFIRFFGELKGEKLKSSPKGFDKEHPAKDLLVYKQFLLMHPISSQLSLEETATEVLATFAAMRPYFDLMTYFLTTNLDGESIV
jgi:uncharacterized protein (TIGR02453 family)